MPLKRTTDDLPPLNLTPMIDVVFLLVIFFMTATQFAEVERALDLELPEVGEQGASVASVDGPIVVSVSSEGQITLDGAPRTPEQLTEELIAARNASNSPEDVEVLIHGDNRCDFQHIADALAACRAARVADVGISVETRPTITR